MNSIVLDLEWNQAQTRDKEAPGLTFEVIEIGAVRLDEHETRQTALLPDPAVRVHRIVLPRAEVVGISMKQLEAEGIPFPDAMERYKWVWKDPVFFTWGDMDLTELQRNIAYFGMENPFAFPLFYYDVQKLYSLYCLDGHARASLESVIETLALPKKWPFHRAVYDAAYTGCVLSQLEKQEAASMLSGRLLQTSEKCTGGDISCFLSVIQSLSHSFIKAVRRQWKQEMSVQWSAINAEEMSQDE